MQSLTLAAKVALVTAPAAALVLFARAQCAAIEATLQRRAELVGSKNRHPAGKGRRQI